MKTGEFDRWVAAYIMFQSDPDNDRDDHPLFWATEKFFDLKFEDGGSELCWKAILEVLRRNPGEHVIGMLGAGPLEDLIEYHGSEYINRIEDEAKANPRFRELLAGVWESSTPDIWSRIEAARGGS